MRLLIAGFCLVGAATAHAQRAIVSAVDAPAIRAARIAQNQAIAAGDANAVANFWTEDVSIRRGLGQPVTGRDAYRQLFARDVAGPRDSALVYQRQTTAVEVSAHWPLAFETGTWVGRVGSAGGPVAIRGRYSAQWVKRDGHWLIRAEVFVALTCAGVGCASVSAP